MKSENLIHIKLEYTEAVQSKKDILSVQRDFLNLLKIIKLYHKLRSDELKLKDKISKKIKDLKTNLSKLSSTLPKIEIPEILKNEREIDVVEGIIPRKTPSYSKDSDLESQIKEIQERLKRLE